MSSPTDKSSRSLPAGPPRIPFLAGLLLLAILSGCAGYHLATDAPSIFGQDGKTLKMKGVDYPTLQAWLPYRIRSALRDEVTARHLASWVDSGPADFEIQVNIISYTSRQWMQDARSRTLLYSTTMTLEAIVYNGSTNKEVWRSGRVAYSENVEQPQTEVDIVITQIIRLLVDKMRSTF
ncbi:MAG: DUF4136 domain-containing protein [Desulfovibrio sp.]|jgi:hypothetical protein|nr:DUF4136 domain-containing protein [Desulfovibrio sp.]